MVVYFVGIRKETKHDSRGRDPASKFLCRFWKEEFERLERAQSKP